MRILLLLIINLSFISVLYSTSTIKGTIKNFSGQTGKVFKYLDFVSYEQQQIADFQIDDNGYFEFELNIEPNSRIRINLNEKDSRLYVQENGIYTLGLKDKEIQLLQEENTDLNRQLLFYQDKILEIAERYNRGGKKKKLLGYNALQSLKEELVKEENEVLKQFVKFEIIMWEIQYLSFGGKKHGDIEVDRIDQVFLNTPPPTNNPFYYDALELLLFSNRFTYEPWVRAPELLNDVSQIPFKEIELYKNTIPEDAVRTKVVDYIYNYVGKDGYENFDRKVATVIQGIKEDHFKQIAERIILETEKIDVGGTFPEFKLQDKMKRLKTLPLYKSEYLLVEFWTTWCVPCRVGKKSFNNYLDKYKGRLNIISISEDENFDKMKRFVDKQKDYRWEFLYAGENNQLSNQLGVNYFPTYFLLDKNRKIIARPKGVLDLTEVLERHIK